MDRLAQLNARTSQLSAAVRSLANFECDLDSSHEPGSAALDPEACQQLRKARSGILACLADLKKLVAGPPDLLQQLASQVQMLACLQWLADFQILACIPLDGSVPVKDLVDLAGVPEDHLVRVVRLTAASGFLKEPAPHVVAHTPLSAAFVADESLVDAAMFLAQAVAPSALQMPLVTQQFGGTPARPCDCAFSLRTGTTTTPGGSFEEALGRSQKLGRQWRAYLRHAAGLDLENEIVDVISQLNWAGLSNACIVEVGARSTSMAERLAERFPSLRILVQLTRTYCPEVGDILRAEQPGATGGRLLGVGGLVLDGPASTASPIVAPTASASSGSTSASASSSPGVTAVHCEAGMPQPVTDADVYILHLREALPSAPPSSTSSRPRDHPTIRSQLHEYLAILRDSSRIVLVLASHFLPEPNSLDNPELEAVARSRDLTLLQLGKESEMEITDLQNMVEGIGDRAGKLVIASWLRSHSGLVLALAVKYQAH